VSVAAREAVEFDECRLTGCGAQDAEVGEALNAIPSAEDWAKGSRFQATFDTLLRSNGKILATKLNQLL
jgi:hypothetical protein